MEQELWLIGKRFSEVFEAYNEFCRDGNYIPNAKNTFSTQILTQFPNLEVKQGSQNGDRTRRFFRKFAFDSQHKPQQNPPENKDLQEAQDRARAHRNGATYKI